MAALITLLIRPITQLRLRFVLRRIDRQLQADNTADALKAATSLHMRHPYSYEAAALMARAAAANRDFAAILVAIDACATIDRDRLVAEGDSENSWLTPIVGYFMSVLETVTQEPTDNWLDPMPPVANRRARGRRRLEVIHVPMLAPAPAPRVEEGISREEVEGVDWDLLLDQLSPPESL
jgi:hypothetical protein